MELPALPDSQGGGKEQDYAPKSIHARILSVFPRRRLSLSYSPGAAD
jgi:hypothetical protein